MNSKILQEAEGYLALGMLDEAWEATENLPPIERSESSTIEIRLRIATKAEKWELGEALANVLICSEIEPERSRRTCARFHHAHARNLIKAGEIEKGNSQISLAIEAWPDIRREIIDDPVIYSTWAD